MSVVHLKEPSYEVESLKVKISEGLNLLGGWEKVLAGKHSILLKPNLVSSGPATQNHVAHRDQKRAQMAFVNGRFENVLMEPLGIRQVYLRPHVIGAVVSGASFQIPVEITNHSHKRIL